MAQKKAVIGTLVFIMLVMVFVGYFALAAETGSQSDPLVTVGYLNELEPKLKAKIDEMIDQQLAQKAGELENQYAAAMQSVQEMIANSSGINTGELTSNEAFINAVAEAALKGMGGAVSEGGVPATFKKEEIPSGKTVKLGLGTLVFLRIGVATCTSTGTPGLIDLTTGDDLANGGSMIKNHLYSCTVESGRGFKTSGGSKTTVFFLGSYTIS